MLMPTETQYHTIEEPFTLRSGATLPSITNAYEMYGELNEDRSNAILVFHALTGSHHAAGFTQSVEGSYLWNEECQKGWWDSFIGPGRAFDTSQFAVICINVLGGCYGTTGPSSINPETGKPYGSSFPRVTFCDMVDVQMRVLDHLGIEKLHAVTGGSVGGYMCLSLATRYPDRVDRVIPIASGIEVTSLQHLHNFEQITAIVNDENFNGGDYYDGQTPDKGLALARMIQHKTFVSLKGMEYRARHEVLPTIDLPEHVHIEYPVESYMWHQGRKFVKRFDANTFLRIIDAWETFDLVLPVDAVDEIELLRSCKDQRFLVFTVDSDVCFYPEEQDKMVGVLAEAGVSAEHVHVSSDKGHDSFLLDAPLYTPYLREFLSRP